MRSARVSASRWLLSLVAFANACGSSSAGGPNRGADAAPPREAETPDRTNPDTGDAADAGAGSMNDAARDGADAGMPPRPDASTLDAGAPPTPVGTTIETGVITLLGVTDDGHVVYQHGNAVKAAPVGGGSATTLLEATDASASNGIVVNVVHDDVFLWSNVDQTNGTATLGVWTPSLATAAIVSTTSVPSVFAASADSSVVAFSDGTSTDGSSTNLVAAPVASLTSHHTLAAGVDPGNEDVPTCPPTLTFSGAGASLFAVVGACTPIVVDGGANGPFVVTAFPASSWEGSVLAASATSFRVDGSGTSAAIFLPSGAIEVAPLDGGAPIALEASSDAGTADAGTALSGQLYLSPTDAFVLWSTRAGALLTSPVTHASITKLAVAGAVDLDAVNSTSAFVLVDQGADPLTGFPEGLSLAPTGAAGPVASLSAGDVFLNVGGDQFTADGRYALYVAGVTTAGYDNPVGTLKAAPVAAPGTPTIVTSSTGSWIDPVTGVPSNTAVALTGSQIAFVDAFDSSLGQAGQATIKELDLSTTAPAKLLVAAADPTFVVSHDRLRVLYTITFGGTTDGLYSIALP